MRRFLRQTGDGEEQRATNLELFFDLVFVFAVTQLSHSLVVHSTGPARAKTLFLLLVVWWAWIYTTWMTNWFDPESTGVRSCSSGVMLASLLMAIAIPEAFGDRAVLFAAVVRRGCRSSATLSWSSRSRRGLAFRPAFVRDPVWSLVTGACSGSRRVLPAAGQVTHLARRAGARLRRLRTPGTGRRARRVATRADWDIEAAALRRALPALHHHRAGRDDRRHRADGQRPRPRRRAPAAIVVALLGTAALWWLYFDYVARIARAPARRRPTTPAGWRGTRTRYIHIPMVAGIIVAAVGDELVIAHPGEQLSGPGWPPWPAARRSTCSATSPCGCAWRGRSAASA